jgi:hypothetical protein
MEIPKQIRTRLLLTFDKKSFFKFYWFEMKNDDFYWGSAYKANHSEKTTTDFDGTEVKIQIPEDFNELEKTSGKYSFHESGQVHYKTNLKNGESNYKNISEWAKKGKIDKPTRFFTVLSRTLKHYDKSITNLTRGNSSAIALNFNNEVKEKRVYFEFFLSPPGEFQPPETLLKIKGTPNDIATQTISPDLILIVRYAVFSNLNDWHPDKELSIITNEIK